MQKTILQKKHKFQIFRFLISAALIFGGIFLVVKSSAELNLFDLERNSNSGASQTRTTSSIPKPYELFIPKLSKVLYITDGQYIGGNWEISKTGVSYLTNSARVGDVGNSVIYGHNLPGILGGLPSVENGDFVYVVLDNGQFYKYRVFDTKAVVPSHVEILDNTQDARLTIYTCTGFLDSARFVVEADLVGGS